MSDFGVNASEGEGYVPGADNYLPVGRHRVEVTAATGGYWPSGDVYIEVVVRGISTPGTCQTRITRGCFARLLMAHGYMAEHGAVDPTSMIGAEAVCDIEDQCDRKTGKWWTRIVDFHAAATVTTTPEELRENVIASQKRRAETTAAVTPQVQLAAPEVPTFRSPTAPPLKPMAKPVGPPPVRR